MPDIIYRSTAKFLDGPEMPVWASDRLKQYMNRAGVDALQISSGYRTPEDQARIMLDNINEHGLQYNYDLYSNLGDRVLNAYSAQASRSLNIANMANVIRLLGPEKISRHMATDAVVFDIAPSSISGEGGFEDLKAVMMDVPQNPAWRQDPGTIYEIGELLYPPKDPALHVEFPGNSSSIPLDDDDSEESGSGIGGGDVVVAGLALAGLYVVAKKRFRRKR